MTRTPARDDIVINIQHLWRPGDPRAADGTYEHEVVCLNCGVERNMVIGKGRPVPQMAGEGPPCDVCGVKNWHRREEWRPTLPTSL